MIYFKGFVRREGSNANGAWRAFLTQFDEKPRQGSLFFAHINEVCVVRHRALESNCFAVHFRAVGINNGGRVFQPAYS